MTLLGCTVLILVFMRTRVPGKRPPYRWRLSRGVSELEVTAKEETRVIGILAVVERSKER